MRLVLILDQWTSTGNIEDFNFSTWNREKVTGGDSQEILKLFDNSQIEFVSESAEPRIGQVWYVEEKGRFKKWKWNYDSSDQLTNHEAPMSIRQKFILLEDDELLDLLREVLDKWSRKKDKLRAEIIGELLAREVISLGRPTSKHYLDTSNF